MYTNKKNCCIITPTEGAYSETFIQNHIRYLGFGKTVIYAVASTDFKLNGRSLFPPSFFNRLRQKSCTVFTGRKDHFLQKRFARLLINKKIDVVLAEYGPAGALVSNTCHALGIPLVIHFHGYDASVIAVMERYREAYKNMFSKAAAVIAVSRSMCDRLEKAGAPRELIHFNPYGVDTDIFKPAGRAKQKIFLAVGRFVEKKAPQITIRAFYKVWLQDGSIRLRMAGDGPLLEECRELVRELGMKDAVDFLGVQTMEAVTKLMTGAYAFLQHSVIARDGNAEGLPLAILEAGASGLPVISTNHEGIADVIQDEFNGLLGNEGDVETMATNILRLVTDESFAERMGENARKRIVEQYNLAAQIARLENILNNAANRI
ncbi:MAG TPA: glycosyltransferase [Chitinophagaceae bacterium]|nr:glycosyltransferase [Chitinophagaceae bacterium]